MKHRSLNTWTAAVTCLVAGSVIAGPPRDRNPGTVVPPEAARLIAGQAESVRDEIDSGTLATGSGPRLRIKPVQIIPFGQGSIAGDTMTLDGGPAILKFDMLFGGWGSTGGGLTTFQATTNGTCIGGLNAGQPCPPADCSGGGQGGFCGNTTGPGSPLNVPQNACTDNAGCVTLFPREQRDPADAIEV